jgi:hypothetical protein
MKRLLMAGVVALAAMGIGAASVPGSADAGFLSHERQQDWIIRRLQNQVAGLQHDVYQCEGLTDPLTVLDQASGRTWGPDVFVDYSC